MVVVPRDLPGAQRLDKPPVGPVGDKARAERTKRTRRSGMAAFVDGLLAETA